MAVTVAFGNDLSMLFGADMYFVRVRMCVNSTYIHEYKTEIHFVECVACFISCVLECV